MNKKYIKKLFFALVIILFLELVYHFNIFKSIDIKEAFYITIFSVLTALFIDVITSLFGKGLNKWLFIIILCFLPIIFVAQFINYQFYGNIISIYSFIHGGQVLEFFGAIWQAFTNNVVTMILFLLPIPLLLIFNKKIYTQKLNFKKVFTKLIIFIVFFALSVLSLNFDSKEIYSAKNLYYYKHVPNSSAQIFGILTTMRLDLERIISNFEETVVIDPNGKVVPPTPIEPEKVIEYNEQDFDFNALAEEATNKKIKSINQYMATQSPTEKNDYTGLFKGKNLIAIVAEAFYPIAVDETHTPTLYKLTHEGFHFTNFYTPLYYASTSDGEYSTLNSLIPKEGVWSFYASRNNYRPYSYGYLFQDLGYTTYAFHDGTRKYYDRHLTHPKMGYTYIACGKDEKGNKGLEQFMNCRQWPQSDVDMMTYSTPYYINEDHFAVYYMTVSGHLEYNFMGNNMARKHKSEVQDIEYSDAIKAYVATQMEFDKSLEILLQELEKAGKLDDTVIVISADHYPYGLTNKQIDEVLDIKDEKFDIHQNNLIIWANGLEYKEIDKYAMSIDILPTVLNLFGFEYDSRLLIGNDILSNAEGLVILGDRSWINEYGKYNASTKKFTEFKELPSEDYVSKMNEDVYNKYVVSKNILENDYYRTIFKGIKDGR